MYVNFQDLCEVKNEDNIVLKETVDSADVKSNEDIINNVLGDVFYKKHNAQNEKHELKDYKLETIILGENLFKEVANYFKIVPENNMYRMFDILVTYDTSLSPNGVKYNYSYSLFQMGSK